MIEAMRFPLANDRVLSVGLDPRRVGHDARGAPVDVEELRRRAAQGEVALAEAGYDVTRCLIEPDPDAAERELRTHLATTVFGLAMVGGGVRVLPQHTLVFERVVNVLATQEPSVRFCFNAGPDTTASAIARWLPDARPAG